MKIEVENISYSYENNINAIENISTSFNSGDFVSIIGHTGSGKSTFIQNLNALLIPTLGKVIVDEFTIMKKIKIKNIKQLRKKIGIVFQFPEYQLFEETVEKDILFGPKNFNFDKNSLKEIARKVINLVGLNESFLDKSPFDLSGGEKRRVAIAGILAFDPDVLIVDEPTAGLDPLASQSMMQLFKKLNEMGKTIILVTHQMDHVLTYASRVLVFKNGNLCFDGTPIHLYQNQKIVKELEIDTPNIITLTNQLILKYPTLKNYEIKSISDFVKAYKEVIKL